MEAYALGVDLGTTSVKVALLKCSGREVVESVTEPSSASVPACESSSIPGADEQNVHKIVECLESCMAQLNQEKLKRVTHIGVCGQMHGCVLWKSGRGSQSGPAVVNSTAVNPFCTCVVQGKLHLSGTLSHLYTWQDGRCSEEFLASLPPSSGPIPLSTGYGCATLAWLKANMPEVLSEYDTAGTVMDFVICGLTGLHKPKMSTHNAVSWGYYDPRHMEWDRQIVSDWFPVHLLPNVVGPGVRVGVLQSPWHGIPEGVEVGVGLGDLQCSVLSAAVGREERVAVLNISTSAQLVAFKPSMTRPTDSKLPTSVMELPFFNDRNILVAASLNGGNILSQFVDLLQRWSTEMGMEQIPIKNDLFSLLIEKAGEFEAQRSAVCGLSITPTLLGERHMPTKKGSVEGIGADVPGLGQVFSATCRGLVVNLLGMMPRDILQQYEVEQILGCGSALERNAVLQGHVKEAFHLPLLMTAADAAKGAALACLSQSPATHVH